MRSFKKVAQSSALKEGRSLSLIVDGEKLVLFRYQQQVYAFVDRCPHQAAPLSHGFVKDGCLTCIYHGWKFSLKDGSFVANPRLKLKAFSVLEHDGSIFLDLNSPTD